jgi:regulator of RNase E activity RraA
MSDSSDEQLAHISATLYTAAVADVLDQMGFRNQVMHQRLRPLLPDRRACGFAGRARTFRWMEVDYRDDDDPYGMEIDGMDSLRRGDVIVHSTDYAGTNAPWGELMTTVARRNGAVGCVCDSNVRDCNRIIDLGFPVYCAGIRPVDSAGRAKVMAVDVPVRCGEVLVHPGDLVFADFDGVVVIPRDHVDEAVSLARAKVEGESVTRRELEDGRSLREVYDQYGIL